jgi:hypothetical protein
MRPTRIEHEFVEFIPEDLAANTVYVSIPYATAVHPCLCGCQERVVTPLSPTDWRVVFDGETVSFHPSIGNWSFPCRSHYVIERNRVRWAGRWSQDMVGAGRARDRRAKQRQFGERQEDPDGGAPSTPAESAAPSSRLRRWLARLHRWAGWHRSVRAAQEPGHGASARRRST